MARLSWLLWALSFLSLAGAVGAQAPSMRETPAARPEAVVTNRLTVRIRNLRMSTGHLGCALYSSAAGYPGDPSRAVDQVLGRIDRTTALCLFDDLTAGRYAVSVAHDEDGDGELDRGLFGIPREPWGASNDAPARFGPPSFSDAVFRYEGGRRSIRIRLRH